MIAAALRLLPSFLAHVAVIGAVCAALWLA